jgi:RNA polymerase sigma factor (TIGR02999 family)
VSGADDDAGAVTGLLRRWRSGERAALDALMPQVYAELKRVAQAHLRHEPGGDRTLQATGLVHETYLRLAAGAEIDWQDRNHFFAASARLMRQILVDHARARRAAKRDGGERITWSGFDVADPADTVDLLALDQAMTQLEALDARKARVVELRVFGGLEFAEIGDVLGLSRATLDRDFRAARLWLYRALESDGAA